MTDYHLLLEGEVGFLVFVFFVGFESEFDEVFDEGAAFFSCSECFDFSEEFRVYCYTYVMFHVCVLHVNCIFNIPKSFISLVVQITLVSFMQEG
jgi:hypothetical protein